MSPGMATRHARMRAPQKQKAADLAGDDTMERRGGVTIARLDQRYGLGLLAGRDVT